MSRLSGPVGRQVRRKRRDLVAAAAAYDVTNLRVFGSVARGEDRPDSDVDLLVDLPPDMGLLDLGRVQADLEAILGAKVDLIPASDLKPAVRARRTRVGSTVTYRERQRLADLQAAIDAIRSYLQRGDLSEFERALSRR